MISTILNQHIKSSPIRSNTVLYFCAYAFLIIVSIVVLFPFYWMLVTAVKPIGEIFEFPPKLWPSQFLWGNFAKAMTVTNFLTYFKNSAIVTFCATVITVFINLLAGYAFAKYRFKGRDFLFMVVLSTLMIPIQLTMIPNFIIVSKLGLLNSYTGLILPPCAEAFGLFLSRQFIAEIPDELIESGRIDGASEFSIFSKIVFPNVRPLMGVLVIFTVMWRWNDFQWPLIVLSDSKMYTVQLGLSMLNGVNYVNWNDLMSAAIISILPVLVVFFIFQKQFVQGIAFTGIKG
jgi:alpha-1,4-digalacturonate transport system permease protein